MLAGLAVLGGLMVVLLTGLPIAFALGLIGYVGIMSERGAAAAQAVTVNQLFDLAQSHTFTVLPLFILMGNLIARAQLSHDLYAAAHALLGHLRGGLAMATIVACAGFSAVSGSSMATASTMARVALPPMREHGYSDRLAAGAIASGGTLGILIPPSVILLLYGILTSTSIGHLFIAGILPGLLGVVGYVAAIAIVTRIDGSAGPAAEVVQRAERWRRIARIWPVALLFVIVLGGIYLGVFTPTEAAGIGATGAFALMFILAKRRPGLVELLDIFAESARTSAMMIALLFGATLFNNYLDLIGFAAAIAAMLEAVDPSPLLVLAVIMATYLVLGCFLESLSMLLLTVPIFFPVIVQLGIDPIWFGILVVVVIEISLITPPVGLNVFVLKGMVRDVSLSAIFRGVLPFLLADLVRLGVLLALPGFVLFLPRLMG